MIILAAAVIISMNNNTVIDRANQAVNLTNEKQIQDLAALTWAECYLDPAKKVDIENSVKTELASKGITEDKWNIQVTNTGVTVTSKLNGDVEDKDENGEGSLGSDEPEEDEYGYLSGTWKFNDVLYLPETSFATQAIEVMLDNHKYTSIAWDEAWGLCDMTFYNPISNEWSLIYETRTANLDAPLWYSESKTLTFTSKQQVSPEFYDWFIANATKVS